MILLEHVTKRYGSFTALEDVNINIPTGQVLGLLGQNGAGKTTLLNILTGCLAPSAGNVRIDSVDLMQKPRQAKRQIGYLPESRSAIFRNPHPCIPKCAWTPICALCAAFGRSRREPSQSIYPRSPK